MIVDAATMGKLVFFECGILGDIFLVVITAMAIFITFGYKAQKLPYYVMLSQEQVSYYYISNKFLKKRRGRASMIEDVFCNPD